VTDYQRKLYAFLQSHLPQPTDSLPECFRQLSCWGNISDLDTWWKQGKITRDIAASSDRINLTTAADLSDDVEVRHPISGQRQTITEPSLAAIKIPPEIQNSTDAKQVFWWFWRFYPEHLAKTNSKALLYPAHRILPDCPLHSYQSTVSALAGAMFPSHVSHDDKPETPYLLLFSFSPVQEFIKASRKFVDFWAGSYLLHYLSARLCWYIAQKYGPDAVIVPSLWNQEIFDALMLQDGEFSRFEEFFKEIAPGESEYKPPAKRFEDRESNSLSTAGFPNMITVLVPGKTAAEKLGQALADELVALWHGIKNKVEDDKGKTKTVTVREGIGEKVKGDIQERVIAFLTKTEDLEGDTYEAKRQTRLDRLQAEGPEVLLDNERYNLLLEEAFPTWDDKQREPYRQELIKLVRESNWEWGHLWDAQLSNTWEPYWAAVPLGYPGKSLVETDTANYEAWSREQDEIAWPPTKLPSLAEKQVYQTELNVGTWWGSLQQRLRTAHMAVKNTRHWQIPAAPGPRSSLSGQFSAVHPRLNYQEKQVRDRKTQTFVTRDFREGGGLPESSMRLFWLLMSYAYKGLLNGSEMLNTLELTKRMAWQFGGVAESMGIDLEKEKQSQHLDEQDRKDLGVDDKTEIDYEKLIRFPNLSSIAAARFMYESYHQPPYRLREYWKALKAEIKTTFDGSDERQAEQRRTFGARTRGRPTQVPKTDQQINGNRQDGHDYNGVMFSAKWLADEMNLEKAKGDNSKTDEVALLRQAIDAAHKETGFGDGSPGDWWVIVLGDGDGMGNYISGETLHDYCKYIIPIAVDTTVDGFDHGAFDDLLHTQKRMGPATHIGLNRALLDFSNRLVPYLTEKRYCGRVIYSGGDDVMAVLPLEDLPGYLRSLRAAWSGKKDPYKAIDPAKHDDPVRWFEESGGYWQPKFRDGQTSSVLPDRPLFTMGKDATMSLGIVIANKAVPLPTVLESLWDAEKTAKAMPGKDGLCFRVIYGGGNTLEALMKGHLLDDWWGLIEKGTQNKDGKDTLSPMLYRLAEELPKRASVTQNNNLFAEAAKVIVGNRDESKQFDDFDGFCEQLGTWLKKWEAWVKTVDPKQLQPGYDHRQDPPLTGTCPEDLGYLLRFSAFWVSKNLQRQAWVQPVEVES
jgi:CRISPR-associated protein Cmr2